MPTLVKLRQFHFLLLIMAACSLIYELLIASTLIFLFGDTIYYFSLTLAFFILFMGIGASLSTKMFRLPEIKLFWIEMLLSLLGLMAPLGIQMLAALSKNGLYTISLAFFFISTIGIFTGMELPLLFKITESLEESRSRFGSLLIYDYLGSLLGSLFFALFLFPYLGLIGSGLIAGLLNLGTALVLFKNAFPQMNKKQLYFGKFYLFVLLGLSGVLFTFHTEIEASIDFVIFKYSENTKIISSFNTLYQKVTVSLTPSADIKTNPVGVLQTGKIQEPLNQWISIYLNNFIQVFGPLAATTDYYHHAFIHPAMLLTEERRKILILGGGDGLPAKEVEKYPEIESITNVDLDGKWLDFARTHPLMSQHNFNSLNHPKLNLVIADAFAWVRESREVFDVIFIDFPEGIDLPLARSYSLEFLKDLKRILKDGGTISFQVDFFNNPVYWSIIRTMLDAGFEVVPHHTLDPSGIYGLIVLSKNVLSLKDYDKKIKSRDFIQADLLLDAQALEFYRDRNEIQKNTANFRVNSFFNPSFLYYYRASYPWEISIGNN